MEIRANKGNIRRLKINRQMSENKVIDAFVGQHFVKQAAAFNIVTAN